MPARIMETSWIAYFIWITVVLPLERSCNWWFLNLENSVHFPHFKSWSHIPTFWAILKIIPSSLHCWTLIQPKSKAGTDPWQQWLKGAYFRLVLVLCLFGPPVGKDCLLSGFSVQALALLITIVCNAEAPVSTVISTSSSGICDDAQENTLRLRARWTHKDEETIRDRSLNAVTTTSGSHYMIKIILVLSSLLFLLFIGLSWCFSSWHMRIFRVYWTILETEGTCSFSADVSASAEVCSSTNATQVSCCT